MDLELLDQRQQIARQIEALAEDQQIANDAARAQITRRIRLLQKKLQDIDVDLTNQSSMDAGNE